MVVSPAQAMGLLWSFPPALMWLQLKNDPLLITDNLNTFQNNTAGILPAKEYLQVS